MTKKSRQKLKYLENEENFWGEIKNIFHHFQRAYSCQRLPHTWECTFKQPTIYMLICAFCCRHMPHGFTSGFLCLHEKITLVWNFTLVSNNETRFKPVWVSLTRNNVNTHNEFTLYRSETLTWREISNWCEFTSGLM